MVLIVQFLPV